MTRPLVISTSVALCLVACAGDLEDDEATAPEPPVPVNCQLVESGYGAPGQVPVRVELVAGDLAVPWSIGWLPEGQMLFTERGGSVKLLDAGDAPREIATLDLGLATQEGGLLGLAIHPRFAENRWFYLYYTTVRDGAVVNLVERWRMNEDLAGASADKVILPPIPAQQFHNGGRMRFGPDGYLYVGTGDAGQPQLSQDVSSLAGKILRVDDEGAIPADNPFAGSATWIYGLRNTQGFDWREDGTMVMTDHGPSGHAYEGGREGHDEINVVRPGDNLGWPQRYACEEGDHIRPSMTWREALPPGGTAIYTGDAVDAWRGDVFIGVLGVGGAIGHLHRVRLDDGGNVSLNETYFLGEGFGRIRDVIMGPDGHLYFTTSNCDGRADCGDGDAIFRVLPQAP